MGAGVSGAGVTCGFASGCWFFGLGFGLRPPIPGKSLSTLRAIGCGSSGSAASGVS